MKQVTALLVPSVLAGAASQPSGAIAVSISTPLTRIEH
ncbi:MAG: hypothetical protein JWQ50_392 [Caballeronia mineralivorans]|jgi:hypothetical protein|nr:hypothetical protein [Caballeronia mineralivorans]MEA3102528.1 hypothetical protein [Caballeronia mineralivorans]